MVLVGIPPHTLHAFSPISVFHRQAKQIFDWAREVIRDPAQQRMARLPHLGGGLLRSVGNNAYLTRISCTVLSEVLPRRFAPRHAPPNNVLGCEFCAAS